MRLRLDLEKGMRSDKKTVMFFLRLFLLTADPIECAEVDATLLSQSPKLGVGLREAGCGNAARPFGRRENASRVTDFDEISNR